tara:strand:+ start:13404 stop:15029 length:1626 start_codon:yes stop_codon:yes gene_type:complete
MIEAELPDGTILQFPDGTDRSVIQRVVKERLGVTQAAPKEETQREIGVVEDVGRSLTSGLVRGAIGTAELPFMAARGIARGGQEALQYLGYDVGEDIPVFQTKTGEFLRGLSPLDDYEAQTRAGKFAGTAAEFVGGGGTLGAAGKLAKVGSRAANLTRAQKAAQAVESAGLSKQALGTATVAGLGSEAAGQVAEGTKAEGAARFIGALASPAAASKFVNMPARAIDAYVRPGILSKQMNTGNRTLDTALATSIIKPSSENLRSAKNAGYKAADDAGVSFSSDQMVGIAENSRAKLFAGGEGLTKYNPQIDTHITQALARVDDVASGTTLRELDTLRTEIYNVYRVGKGSGVNAYDPRLRSVIDEIDDLIDTNLQGSRLLNAARVANKRYKKSELLRDALDSAEVTAKTTTSGDVIAGYRRAVGRILNNKKQRNFFDKSELDAMSAILDGTVSDDVLKRLGTLSPTTNGLQRSIAGVAAFIEPTTLAISGLGLVSKFASDTGVKMQLRDLDRLLATGQAPMRFRPTRVAPALGAAQDFRQEQ